MNAIAGGPTLDIRGLQAWYGDSHVLQGVNLEVGAGEVVALLGRNGAGKTTMLRSVMGLIEKRSGSVRISGVETIAGASEDIARLGLSYCPEERGIFSTLTVRENLLLPPVLGAGGMTLPELFELFPNIEPRLGNPGARLSGGEQQMLAIARILRTGNRFLLLDEPTEGLAPVIVEQIVNAIHRLRERRYTVLLVEQNLTFCEQLADRHYVMESGRIVDEVSTAGLASRRGILESYLGV